MPDPITPLTPAQVAVQEQQTAHEGYVRRALVAVDIAADELTGSPMDETISTRPAVDAVKGHGISKEVGKIGSAILNIFEKDHGANAAAGDLYRAQAEEKIVEQSGIA